MNSKLEEFLDKSSFDEIADKMDLQQDTVIYKHHYDETDCAGNTEHVEIREEYNRPQFQQLALEELRRRYNKRKQSELKLYVELNLANGRVETHRQTISKMAKDYQNMVGYVKGWALVGGTGWGILLLILIKWLID